jgi:cell division GTPase FtsZ
MSRIHDIVTLINKQASPAAYTIFSAVVNPELDGDFRVSILAHGFRET